MKISEIKAKRQAVLDLKNQNEVKLIIFILEMIKNLYKKQTLLLKSKNKNLSKENQEILYKKIKREQQKIIQDLENILTEETLLSEMLSKMNKQITISGLLPEDNKQINPLHELQSEISNKQIREEKSYCLCNEVIIIHF